MNYFKRINVFRKSNSKIFIPNSLLFYKFLETLKKKLTIIIISHKENILDICNKLYKLKKLN